MSIAGVGVDIIEIVRIGHALEKLQERFLKRIYTEREVKYCQQFSDPVPHLAARFAAKEATMKSLGVGIYSKIPWTDFEVANHDSGEPYIILHGKAEARAKELGIINLALSLSHNRSQAIAVVVAER